MNNLMNRGWTNIAIIFKSVLAARLWLIAYVVLILIPASIFLYAYSQRYSRILEEEVTRTMLQTLKQAEINLNHQINSLRDTSNAIFMNPKLLTYLSSSSSYDDQFVAMNELRYMVDNARTNLNVFRVRLYVDESKLFSHEKVNFFPLASIEQSKWYPEVVNAGGLLVWTGAYLEHFIDIPEDPYIFSGLRILRDPEHYDHLSGILSIDVDAKILENIVSNIKLNDDQHVFLTAPDGTIVLHSDKSLLGTKLKSSAVLNAIGMNKEGVSAIEDNDIQQYIVYTTVQATGWKLIAEVPKKGISSRAASLNQFSSVATLTGVTILFLILVFILLAFIVRGMNRRVQTVIRVIKREGIEGLDERYGASGGDINLLEKSVDHLIHRVRDLMEETYKSKVQEREAQLKALQAQINPHFLYNTLDTINWIAIGHKAHDISQMIDGLAKYFRLSLNKGRDVVTVMDELELARVYLDIQQNRFPKSFEVIFQIETPLDAYEMPKLTLQPIVENALLHGIRKSKGKSGTIWIRAYMDGSCLALSVRDDGIGMEQAFAQSLLTEPRPIKSSDGATGSYGLYNVNERIKLYTGETAGLEIVAVPGEGTTVIVRLNPKINQ
ncbi:sensor histidine kinase [Paenibacillus sp. HWE-109]|uniref:cache domain-containing sensor histidine kinase n=1 Tax=Paenibacillus sp. HWE-109 TaxID=1306526 RepID=UPI001EDCBF7F|nr:sensor histidine kinase [Paenibacillus sp. HWE-109]UKS27140.1 sensor histidine kinase [Paenibacillus sp. HWE-109]